jgi:hypothetical protein
VSRWAGSWARGCDRGGSTYWHLLPSTMSPCCPKRPQIAHQAGLCEPGCLCCARPAASWRAGTATEAPRGHAAPGSSGKPPSMLGLAPSAECTLTGPRAKHTQMRARCKTRPAGLSGVRVGVQLGGAAQAQAAVGPRSGGNVGVNLRETETGSAGASLLEACPLRRHHCRSGLQTAREQQAGHAAGARGWLGPARDEHRASSLEHHRSCCQHNSPNTCHQRPRNLRQCSFAVRAPHEPRCTPVPATPRLSRGHESDCSAGQRAWPRHTG